MKEIKISDPTPLVSIIVPAYNEERFIADCLNGLVAQVFKDIEIIVVDDGSKDNTVNVVKKFFFDRRVRLIEKENGGTGSALNAGHQVARGMYLTWCSADNFYFPNFVSTLVGAMMQIEQSDMDKPIEFVYSDFTYIDEKGRRLRDVIHRNPQPRHDLINGYDLGMSFLYTKALWDKTGPFWDQICEDYHWAVRAAQYTEFGLVRQILAAFRVHNSQITGSNKALELEAANKCKELAKQFVAAGKYEGSFRPRLVEVNE